MPTFNIHYTCKANKRHVAKIEANDSDTAQIKLRKDQPGIAYINKVKLNRQVTNGQQ